MPLFRVVSQVLLALSLFSGRARAEEIETLQDAIREIRRLQARVSELESSSPTAPMAAPTAQARPFDLQLYGSLRLDAVLDDSRPNDPQVIGWVQPEGQQNDDETSLSIYPRLTRLGVNVRGPRLAALGRPETSGRLEIDFYALPSSDSRNQIRMRHAFLQLGWGGTRLLAGQTADLISPLFPAVNADLVMWGAGNLGDRRPQIRLERDIAVAEGHVLILQGATGLSGANSGDDFDGNNLLDGEAAGRPTWQARSAYRTAARWAAGDLELGLWGHRAWQEIDTPIAGRGEFDSRALGLDWSIPLVSDRVWAKGELWTGENLADVRGGIFQGVNRNTGDEIAAKGGWLELGWQPWSRHVLSAGFAWDDPRNGDLTRGDANHNRSSNRIFYLSSVENRFSPFIFGVEYLHWTTHFVGSPDGTDDRVKGFMSLSF